MGRRHAGKVGRTRLASNDGTPLVGMDRQLMVYLPDGDTEGAADAWLDRRLLIWSTDPSTSDCVEPPTVGSQSYDSRCEERP
jgi:hypothetical protein